MQSEPARWGDDGVFDPATVVGLRSDQWVLVFGNPAFMPWLTRENEHTTGVRKINEAIKTAETYNFDRVIIGKEFDVSHWTTLAIAARALDAKRGVLVYFPKTPSDAFVFRQNIDFAFPASRVWENETTFGNCIQVELIGGTVA